MTELDRLSDDLLSGVAAIASFTGLTQRRVYYLIGRGALPAHRLGNRSIIAFKSEIDAALRRRDQASEQ